MAATVSLLTTQNPGGSPNTVNVTFYVTTVTPATQAQRVSIGQTPTGNPNFLRIGQLSSDYVFIQRGATKVAFSLADLGSIAAAQSPALSYLPLITTQPVAKSVVSNASNANVASFNVAANSESTLTYYWVANNGAAAVILPSGITNWAGAQLNVSANVLNIAPGSNTPNAYSIFCTVHNATGNTNSSIVTLSVT